jgi:hypothetical protein
MVTRAPDGGFPFGEKMSAWGHEPAAAPCT